MTTCFLSEGLWPELTRAIRRARGRCDVAVAYFGRGADRLVPLSAGSRLVVDASEQAVGSGQTYPPGLLRLMRRGARVFSLPNLHAKVFVAGSMAYVGSTNASSRSNSQLLEAAIKTDLPRAVTTARQFVRAHCLHELSPSVLRRLARLYRPPKIVGRRGRRAATSKAPALPRVFLAQLRPVDYSEREEAVAVRERPVAERRRQHGRRYTLDEFIYYSSPFEVGDLVVQVTNQGSGKFLVTAPGNVTHKKRMGPRQWMVFLECPVARRRPVRSVARLIGQTQKRLRRGGRVDPRLAERLLRVWQ